VRLKYIVFDKKTTILSIPTLNWFSLVHYTRLQVPVDQWFSTWGGSRASRGSREDF